MDETKDLREQMAAMKRSLDNYAIVNENLIATVMKNRTQGLNWFVNAELISTPFICLFFFGFCYAVGISVWIAVTISVACVMSVIVDIRTMKISSSLINRLNLNQLREFLIRQKRNRKLQIAIESPLMAAWIVWFVLSFLENEMMFGDIKGAEWFIWVKLVTVITMLIVSAIAVCVVFMKSQSVNNAMLGDIDLLEDTTDTLTR